MPCTVNQSSSEIHSSDETSTVNVFDKILFSGNNMVELIRACSDDFTREDLVDI